MSVSAPLAVYGKDPSATKDYSIDYSQWLGDDTLSASSWSVPSGLVDGGGLLSAETTTIWLGGGVAGVSYDVVNTVTSSGGRIDRRTLRINVLSN